MTDPPEPPRPQKAEEAPLTGELRALYDRWEAAATPLERQAAWDTIVRYLREHEVRVGSQAEDARQQVLREHARRKRWWIF